MPRTSITTGVLYAALAAVAFGVATPIVARAGQGIGPLATAACLYFGAAFAALAIAAGRRALSRSPEAAVRRPDVPRLVAVALAGGAIAPALLAWGLQRAGATAGALLLNLEAVFTVLLARAVYREAIGRRIAVAVACMAAGGVAIGLDAALAGDGGAATSVLGVLAIAGATIAWATDNTLTRPLAERDPFQVILAKGLLGAAATSLVGLARGEALPPPGPALALLACGATGYGASLYLYLLAQRRIGAARTGSVFALAPFIGAALAWALGDRGAGALAIPALGLFVLGVYLHASERHAHAHAHPPEDHDHVHRHDDGHHAHAHDPPFSGEHAHPHHHDHLAHAHEHAPDIHHHHDH